MSVKDIIAKYVELRDEKARIEKEAKEAVTEIRDGLAKLEAALLSLLDTQGVDSFKTAGGTAFRTRTDRATVRDWEATLDFIKGEKAFDLLERKVSKVAVRSYIEETGGVPPGIDFSTVLGVNIRRPNK